MKRFIIAVLDSVGAGALPDAAAYHSVGANTLGHIADFAPLHIPNLQALGLGNILPLANVPPSERPAASWGKMAASSAGMDTTCGHWEISGVLLQEPLPTYPNGFPDEILRPFCERIGRGVLGNCTASGTEIIQQLGPEHMATGKPILYTSADSVFQLAAHEKVIPLEQLYEYCRIARELLQLPHNVGRVIARPFVGDEQRGFERSENRRDFSLIPPPHSLPEQCCAAGVPVISVGKIYDIFACRHIDRPYPGHNNTQSGESLLRAMDENHEGFIFANFVDFDTVYGHRNDVSGYHKAIEEFDAYLPRLLERLEEEDVLAVCADHGNDPTAATTDHTREYVPLLVYGKKLKPKNLGIRPTFADLGQTVAQYLQALPLQAGTSFLNDLFE